MQAPGPCGAWHAYVLAGLAHATLATAVMFWINELDFRLFRWLAVWSVFAWPIVAALTMTAAVTRRHQVLLVGAYFAWLLVLEIAETFQLRYKPEFRRVVPVVGDHSGAPNRVIVLLANRAWRSVGLTAVCLHCSGGRFCWASSLWAARFSAQSTPCLVQKPCNCFDRSPAAAAGCAAARRSAKRYQKSGE
jgi:hypothetical protein